MFKIQKHEARTLTWWHRQKSSIDFSPPYQRKGGVWTEKSKSFLIDSIINGFDIPKIYLADFRYSDNLLNLKKLPFAVIDGKQRLEAIFDFLDDKIKLAADFKYFSSPEINISGMTYSQIKAHHPEIAFDVIEQFNIDVVSVITDSEEKIRELFIRLNQGNALKGAEIRNALSGDLPNFVRKICASTLFEKSTFSKKRGQDYNAAAKLCLIALHGKFVNTKKRDLDKFFSSYNGGENSKLDRLLTELEHIGSFFQRNDPALKREALIPLIYMLFIKSPISTHGAIRDFMNTFLVNLRNAKMAQHLGVSIRPDFMAFDNFTRNANDVSGLNGAFEVLAKNFDSHLKEKNQAP